LLRHSLYCLLFFAASRKKNGEQQGHTQKSISSRTLNHTPRIAAARNGLKPVAIRIKCVSEAGQLHLDYLERARL